MVPGSGCFLTLANKQTLPHCNVMKTSDSTSFATVPSLFQIAAFFEDFLPPTGVQNNLSPTTGNLPFAEIMGKPGETDDFVEIRQG